jgi:hypothetical protein
MQNDNDYATPVSWRLVILPSGRIAIVNIFRSWAFWAALPVCVVGMTFSARAGGYQVHINVESEETLNKSFEGIGFGVSAHLGNPNEIELDEVFVKRWREMAPAHALLAYTADWDWTRVVPLIKRIYAGSDLWVTTVNFDTASDGRLPDADKVAELLDRLVRKEGVKRVTRYIACAPWPGAKASSTVSAEEVSGFTDRLTSRLQSLGLDIAVNANVPGVTINIADLAGMERPGMELASKCIEAMNGAQPFVTIMTWNDWPAGSGTGLFEWAAPDYAWKLTAVRDASVDADSGWQSLQSPSDVPIPEFKFACLYDPERNTDTHLFLNPNQAPMQMGWGMNHNPKGMRRIIQYRYQLTDQPQSKFGDLQSWLDGAGPWVGPSYGKTTQILIGSNDLSVVTSKACTEEPEKVYQVNVSESDSGGTLLTWDHVANHDQVYYRIYRLNMPKYKFAKKEQIGSTVGNRFIDKDPPTHRKAYYAVITVDHDGNQSE